MNIEHKKCTGCGACATCCPHNCITMREDTEGFLYPQIDLEQCIHCNLCERVCPVMQPISYETCNIPQAYAVQATDEKILEKSSSGGAFTLLAKKVLDQGGVVAGAAFDNNFEVEHIVIDRPEKIILLQGSKYVQSDASKAFYSIREALRQGKTALFCGTPCQVEGILHFIGNQKENLITVDLLCHGVPSRKVWRKYLGYRKEQDHNRPQKISFRDKAISWKTYSMKFDYGNVAYCKAMTEDYFLKGFIRNLYLRPCCYQCEFKTLKRHSDLTIGDFWEINKFSDEFDERGTSLVFCHTKKGKELLKSIAEEAKIQSFDDATTIPNGGFSSAFYNIDRKKFFRDLDQYDFDVLYQYYFSDRTSTRIKRLISRLLYQIRKE